MLCCIPWCKLPLIYCERAQMMHAREHHCTQEQRFVTINIFIALSIVCGTCQRCHTQDFDFFTHGYIYVGFGISYARHIKVINGRLRSCNS